MSYPQYANDVVYVYYASADFGSGSVFNDVIAYLVIRK